jgi:hypothetical protein
MRLEGPDLCEKRGIWKFDLISRGRATRRRNSFRVPLEDRGGFAAGDQSRTTEVGHSHLANGAAAPVLIFVLPAMRKAMGRGQDV